MGCPSGKRFYPDKTTAVEALIEARIQYEHNKAVNVYNCDDCGQWHLTSIGEMNTSLKTYLESDTMKAEKLARDWNNNFK